MKKQMAIILALGILFMGTACGKEHEDETTTASSQTKETIAETTTQEHTTSATETTITETTVASGSEYEHTKAIKAVYAPYILPDGYHYESLELGDDLATFLYIHQENGDIRFSQKSISNASTMGDEWKTETHGEFTIFQMEEENRYTYRFQHEDYMFELTFPNEITKEEIYHVIDSIDVKHIIDYSNIDGYNQTYHYYACISCEDCGYKCGKYHVQRAHQRDGKLVFICIYCGYTD